MKIPKDRQKKGTPKKMTYEMIEKGIFIGYI